MAYHNWRRPLPRPIVIPKVMTLSTLEDVRALVHRHLPAEYRSKQTWQRVASITSAARGELPPDEVAVALELVLLDRGRFLPLTGLTLKRPQMHSTFCYNSSSVGHLVMVVGPPK